MKRSAHAVVATAMTDARVREILNERIKVIYRYQPVLLGVNAVVGGAMIYGLWNVVPATALLFWGAAAIAALLLRAAFYGAYRRAAAPDEGLNTWAGGAVICSAASGALWGAAGLFLFPPESLEYQLFILFILMGMGAGAVSSLTTYMPAFYAFLPVSLVPIGVRLLFENQPIHTALGIMTFAYLGGLSFFATTINRTITESLRLKGVGAAGPSDTVLARYLESGDPDPGFDADGKVRIDIRSDDDGAQALAIQQPGDLPVVAGFIGTFGVATMQDFMLARFDGSGALDPAFGPDGDGVVREDFDGWTDAAVALGIDGQGRIVAAGTASDGGADTDYAVARYDRDGALDTAGFRNPDGKIQRDLFGTDTQDVGAALAVLPGDGIEVAGSVDLTGIQAFAFAPFDADGDTSPASATEFFGFTAAVPHTLAVLPDGYRIAAGYAADASDRDFALLRTGP